MKTQEYSTIIKKLEEFNNLPEEKKCVKALSEAIGFDVLERARELAEAEVDLFISSHLQGIVKDLWDNEDYWTQAFKKEYEPISVLDEYFTGVKNYVLEDAWYWEHNYLNDTYEQIIWDIFTKEFERGEGIVRAIHDTFYDWSDIDIELDGFIVYVKGNNAVAMPYESDWTEELYNYRYELEEQLTDYGYANASKIAKECITIIPHHRDNVIDDKTYEFYHYYSIDDAVRFANEIISELKTQ